jgi:hypothetical protein
MIAEKFITCGHGGRKAYDVDGKRTYLCFDCMAHLVAIAAGRECIQRVEDTRSCPLCNYADHDRDGGERHEDECPLRVLDSP